MKKITDFIGKPLHFALLMGVLTASLVYNVGLWSVSPTRESSQQALTLFNYQIQKAFLLSERPGEREKGRHLLDEALKHAIQHPHILSVTFLSKKNEILGMAHKPSVLASERSLVLTDPLYDANGLPLGMVTMALHENHDLAARTELQKTRWTALLGFVLAFMLCYGISQRANLLVPQLKAAFKKVSMGNFDVELPSVNDPEAAELSDAFGQMLEGLQERDRMRHSLGRIMDPKIAEILIKENPKVGGLRREATILFCDIRNYTTICEQLSPDELQEFLNDYWKDTVEIIMEQEGTIDKFHGDGVCVVFGAPSLHQDDPVRAIRTAWRLVANVEKLNKRREASRKIPIQIGIGIHSGEVIAGNIGSDRRMDYTVVGDVVNVAARIEELNKKFGTKILISDNVYEKVEEYVRVKTITLAHLRGHKRPILVHTIREFIDVIQTVPMDIKSEQKKAA